MSQEPQHSGWLDSDPLDDQSTAQPWESPAESSGSAPEKTPEPAAEPTSGTSDPSDTSATTTSSDAQVAPSGLGDWTEPTPVTSSDRGDDSPSTAPVEPERSGRPTQEEAFADRPTTLASPPPGGWARPAEPAYGAPGHGSQVPPVPQSPGYGHTQPPPAQPGYGYPGQQYGPGYSYSTPQGQQPYTGQPQPAQGYSGTPHTSLPNAGQPQPYRGHPYAGQPQPYAGQPYGGLPSGQGASAPTSAIVLLVISALLTLLTFWTGVGLVYLAPTIIGIVATTRAKTDLVASKRLTRTGWLVFGILTAVGALLTILGIVLLVQYGDGGSGSFDGSSI